MSGENMTEKYKISDIMYIAKSISLFSIILAHTYYSSINNIYVVRFIARVSTIGVVMFLFTSGYYWNGNLLFIEFIKKTVKRLLIPWFVMGGIISVLYTYKYFSLKAFINALLGQGSYLYYLSVLLMIQLIYILCSKILKNNYSNVNIVFMLITILSIIFTAAGVLPYKVDNDGYVFLSYSVYLNVFNWIGFFALGNYVKQKGLLMNWLNSFYRYWPLSFFIFCCITYGVNFLDNSFSYFSYFGVIVECFGIVCILDCSNKLLNRKSSNSAAIFREVAKLTFPIYVLHMPVIGILNNFATESIPITLIKPILVIIVLTIFIKIGKLIASNLHTENIYCLILGIRT